MWLRDYIGISDTMEDDGDYGPGDVGKFGEAEAGTSRADEAIVKSLGTWTEGRGTGASASQRATKT